MPLKPLTQILVPDERFSDMVVVGKGGLRQMTLGDHHASIAAICMQQDIPQEICEAFDRARNVLIYAWFEYELLVVGETQALFAFELALKFRLKEADVYRRGSLRNLIDLARKHGILPPLENSEGYCDGFEALLNMRNNLSHGTSEVHSPGMAFEAVLGCARAIDLVFS